MAKSSRHAFQYGMRGARRLASQSVQIGPLNLSELPRTQGCAEEKLK